MVGQRTEQCVCEPLSAQHGLRARRSPLEFLPTARYNQAMNTEVQELVRICESLPDDKRAEVADFARFLLAREDDERWERLIAFGQRRPKLDAFLRQSAAEPSTSLDVDRL